MCIYFGILMEREKKKKSPIRRYADIVAHRQLLTCVEDPVAVQDTKLRESVMFKDGTISDICDNLNLKSRESKFAQRVPYFF